jgi:hypothetical protein
MTSERAGKAAVVALCAYETAAVVTGRMPTVSAMCRRRRWVEAALLAVLLAHLHHAAAAGPVPADLEASPWMPAP